MMPIKLMIMMFTTLFLLFGFLFGILAALGYYFGISGFIIVFGAILLVFIQWLIGPTIIWWTTNMRPLEKNEYPWIWEIVESISKKYKIPMPKKIALVRSGAPNAFVFGRTHKSATLAITQGLLNNLTKEEVKAVIGHEMGHIKHKDMIVMTIVSAIPIIAYFIARFVIFSPSDRRERGAAVLVGLFAFLIYFITNLLVLALSRLREFYADRFGGIATSPKLLASALAKITYGLSLNKEEANQAVRAFFIADPITSNFEVAHFSNEYKDLEISNEEVKKAMEWEKKNIFARISEFFRTHPLSFKRINALLKLEEELRKKI